MEFNRLNQWGIEYNSGIPVYRQIINRVSGAVTAGDVKAGDQLPTIRVLSEHLNVNPNTVAKAYRELELKGIIFSERGSGSFIQAQVQAQQAPVDPPAAPEIVEKKAKLESLYRRLLGD